MERIAGPTSSGNFWLYRGRGILIQGGRNYGEGNFSDLWEYQSRTKEWTW